MDNPLERKVPYRESDLFGELYTSETETLPTGQVAGDYPASYACGEDTVRAGCGKSARPVRRGGNETRCMVCVY